MVLCIILCAVCVALTACSFMDARKYKKHLDYVLDMNITLVKQRDKFDKLINCSEEVLRVGKSINDWNGELYRRLKEKEEG